MSVNLRLKKRWKKELEKYFGDNLRLNEFADKAAAYLLQHTSKDYVGIKLNEVAIVVDIGSSVSLV